jgi:hypothetical protein
MSFGMRSHPDLTTSRFGYRSHPLFITFDKLFASDRANYDYLLICLLEPFGIAPATHDYLLIYFLALGAIAPAIGQEDWR